MYSLVARDDNGRVVGSVPLAHRPLTIGRSPECTLQLPSTAVSRTHATVHLQQDGAAVVNDEGSANGVQVDGHYITGPTVVGPGNRIQISSYSLSLEPAAAAAQHLTRPPPAQAHVPPQQPAPPGPHPHGGPHPPTGALQAPGARQPPGFDADAYAAAGLTMQGQMVPTGAAAAPAPDPDTEEEEMDTCLEPMAGAGTMLANTTLQLRGRGGPYDGAVFDLEKPLLTVGRIEGNDVVLEDPSVSRRHAQIRVSAVGDRCTVLDLRSSNGTYVDGERVKRAECTEGSIVRFGDLAFKLSIERRQQGANKKKPRASRRKILLLAALGVVVLLVGVGVVAKLTRPEPPPPKVVTPEEQLRLLQAEVQSLVDEGKRRMSLKQWTAAMDAFEKARGKDPLNEEAKRLHAEAAAELEAKKVYEKGMEYFGLGGQQNLIKAKETFQRVPSSSVYRREVRYKLSAINERLADAYRIDGVSQCKARYWRKCHAALCKFFELLPEGKMVAGESKLRKQLERVERRLSRRRGFTPCEAKRFKLGPKVVARGEDPDTALADRYSEAPIRKAMRYYYDGRIENALKTIKKLTKMRTMRPHLAALRELNRQLLIIRGKYQEGYSAYRERDVVQANKHWSMVLDADKALMPRELESFYRREVTRALGDLYYQSGREAFKVGHHREAFEYWIKGKDIDPSHEKILNGLLELEKIAERLLREARPAASTSEGRAKITMARDITAIGRPIHKEAKKLLGP